MTVEFTRSERFDPYWDFIGLRTGTYLSPKSGFNELNIVLPSGDFKKLVWAMCNAGIVEGTAETGQIIIPNVLMKVNGEFPDWKRRLAGIEI